eukprot:g1583.t1
MANILPRVAGLFMAEGGKVDDDSLAKDTGSKCPNQNLADPARRIWVFTTASLPWMTGTAVNPLLRAAYLTRGRDKGKITLGVPWLEQEDQDKVYPRGKRYETKEDQAAYVREWLVPDEEADVAVLEEPEHLNFFRAEGVPWLKKFEYVVGIIHTNYQFYARTEKHGRVKKPIVRAACAFTVRAHCHRIIKLSDALQGYAKEKEMVENVHGVRPQFFEVGDQAIKNGFTADAYFIGKVLWTKGIDILLALMHNARISDESKIEPASDTDDTVPPGAVVADAQAAAAKPDEEASTSPPPPPPPSAGEGAGNAGGTGVEAGVVVGGDPKPFPIVLYGNGSDLDEVKAKVEEMDLPVTFHDAIDHAELGKYKVFVNPSQSEVLCTTIAEALAMGKWVVCARHPSNEFFFTNFETCLSFGDEDEFLSRMKKALAEDPPALSEETRHKLSWAAATDRFLAAASRPEVPGRNSASKSARGLARLDKLLAALHQQSMRGKGGDLLRHALGGGPVANQTKFTRENASPSASAPSSTQSSPKGGVKRLAETPEEEEVGEASRAEEGTGVNGEGGADTAEDGPGKA